MKKKDIITLFVLIGLTILTALFSTQFNEIKYVSLIILLLSAVKFLLVAFQFMELKKAHVFWKVILVAYLSIFLIIMTIVI
jgi:hypothetical protein